VVPTVIVLATLPPAVQRLAALDAQTGTALPPADEHAISGRFPLKEDAVRWAEGERAHAGEALDEVSE
jgi:hypothetical protein